MIGAENPLKGQDVLPLCDFQSAGGQARLMNSSNVKAVSAMLR